MQLRHITARADSVRPDREATRDLILFAALCALAVALAWQTHAIRAISDRTTGALGSTIADALTTLVLVLPAATSLFAYRRYTAAKRGQDQLAQLSMQDPLTGLANRRYLGAWLDHVLARSRSPYFQIAVLFVDLDRYKAVNDTYGHEVGDQLMIGVAARLQAALRGDDRVVRYGGDEFVVVCTDVSSKADAERIADRLIAAISEPVIIAGEAITISASVGIALATAHEDTRDQLLREADDAMCRAKAIGGTHATFDRSTKPASRRHLADRLQHALDRDQFVLHYQPVVAVEDGALVGVEALIRWDDPDRGVLPPSEFVPLLEESGLIVPVGTWVLEEACRQARRWRTAFPDRPPLRVTVNVAARQLAQADFAAVLARAFSTTGVEPSQLCLEITESALMQDVTGAWAALRRAKVAGVSLALDDFGTGYSSLSYIRRFSLDMLKVDRSFIEGLGASPEDAAIVEHVIGMAQALGMEVVGEGVETAIQLEHLRRFGCDLAQGYLFSRPVEAEAIDDMLRAEARPARQHAALQVLADPTLEGMPLARRAAANPRP